MYPLPLIPAPRLGKEEEAWGGRGVKCTHSLCYLFPCRGGIGGIREGGG